MTFHEYLTGQEHHNFILKEQQVALVVLLHLHMNHKLKLHHELIIAYDVFCMEPLKERTMFDQLCYKEDIIRINSMLTIIVLKDQLLLLRVPIELHHCQYAVSRPRYLLSIIQSEQSNKREHAPD